jgi:hypothetical protein
VELRKALAVLALVAVIGMGAGAAAGAAASPKVIALPTVSTPKVVEHKARTTGPLRIVLAGDSVMAGMAPAAEHALESGGDAQVQFVLTPTILRDATIRFAWLRELDRFDPDVVVMFVGTWELGEVTNGRGQTVGTEDSGWMASYERDVLDPWVKLLTEKGAKVIWLGAPAVRSDAVNLEFLSLNAAYQELARRNPAVRYLDTSSALARGGTGYVEVATLPNGQKVRIRQVDGLHLCPEGAVRLTSALLKELRRTHHISVEPGWQQGSWRQRQEYTPSECPPVG